MATKAETREAILEAALRLFTRYGPIKTSVADIARELGMSAANIYNFYPSRDAILEAVGKQNLAELQRDISAEIARTHGDWARMSVLFISTARNFRDKLDNEKDIIQLQSLERKNRWQFVADFHEFLRRSAEQILQEAIASGRFAPTEPKAAVEALFDCMISALDPLILLKFTREEHSTRIAAQLALLEKAFR